MRRAPLIPVLATGIALGFGLSLAVGGLAGRDDAAAVGTPRAPLPPASLRLLDEALRRIATDYVDAVPERRLLEHAVRGMAESLDAHSTWLDAGDFEQLRAATSGAYPGIGIEVDGRPEGLVVLRVIADAPAARAGLQAGDLIVGVDGVDVGGEDDGEIVSRLRGQPGTSVRLRVRRDGSASPLDFALERGRVAVHSVDAALPEPGLAYLRLTQFNDATTGDARAALDRLARGGPLRGLVLDLRNNPGGVLDSAVALADDFLDAGNIVSADGRGRDAKFRHDATPGDRLRGAPIVVLLNGGSASASEILAAALHDNGRATLLGRRSYGKGSVQSLLPLAGGGALKLTTSRYFTPSGASINEVGIEPDIPWTGEDLAPAPIGDDAAALPARDPQVRLALETLKRLPAARAAGNLQAAR